MASQWRAAGGGSTHPRTPPRPTPHTTHPSLAHPAGGGGAQRGCNTGVRGDPPQGRWAAAPPRRPGLEGVGGRGEEEGLSCQGGDGRGHCWLPTAIAHPAAPSAPPSPRHTHQRLAHLRPAAPQSRQGGQAAKPIRSPPPHAARWRLPRTPVEISLPLLPLPLTVFLKSFS